MTTSDYVEREVRIRAQPETIFPFFTDPVKMMQWKGVEASLDPRPGGIYQVNVTGSAIVKGEYLEVSPYTRVVFSWGWLEEGHPVPPGSSIVEVDLVPDGDATIVRLRHSGLSAEGQLQHAAGWEHFLPRLVEIAEGREPGIDPWTQQQEEHHTAVQES
jgi:uncharacterized protein YndB with AHSA1/START domain